MSLSGNISIYITICLLKINYNAAETIETTFRSVVGQSFTDYEYIVVDGDSKDGTVDFLRSRKDCLAVFISEPDKGLYDAMNKGMHLAKGEYLIFLNAGDTFHSENTLADIAVSIGSSRPDVIYGETALVNDKREFLGMRRLKTPETLNWKSFRMGMLVCHQAFIAKRTLAPDYDLSYRFSSDFDWCIRCMKRAGTLWNTHLTLIDYLNEGVTTRNHKASLKERYNIMVKYYGRIPVMFLHLWFALRFYTAKWIKGRV